MAEDASESAPYRGVLGAFRYAWRSTDSWGFRAYVVLAGVVTVGIAVVIVGGVLQLLATAGRSGGVAAFVRAFYIVVGVAVIAPVIAPVLVVARRRRLSRSVSRRAERRLGGAGVLFIALVYLGLVASTPPTNQRAVEGVFAPVAVWLYGLPRIAGLVFPVVGAVGVYVAVRTTREP